MAWAVIRLYGFRLIRARDDLRTTFGLLTRVAATIPRHRIQAVTILQGPLHRLLNRVSVRVETAGGAGSGSEARGSREREWLAPLLKREALPELLHHIEPALDLDRLPWQPVDPRAFRRVVKKRVLGALLVSGVLAWPLGLWAALAVLVLALAIAAVSARKYVDRLAWATTDDVVALRSGWLWRSLILARAAKIQAVTELESPFDRRAAMAQVKVDTAGAGIASHRVHIRYLPRDTADALRHRLAAQAASSAFRW
jgi:putative membrane protein